MELTDLLSGEAWARFEKELYDRFHLSCTVYDTSGFSITGKQNWCNKLCPAIEANKESLAAICAPANQNFMAIAKQTKKAVIEECDAGLLKITVPIFAGDEFLGTAGGCGVLLEGGEVEDFIIQKTAGLDEEEIESLCRDMETMTEEEAGKVAAAILERIAEIVTEKTGD
jgi:ligand-binding sensor protein